MERRTIKNIREAVRKGIIPAEFRAVCVNKALNIHWADNFLPKHCVENPGSNTELFTRIKRGLYKLNVKEA